MLKAELPRVDPDKDITITVDGDGLRVGAEHEESSETKDYRVVSTVRCPR